jgi:hypothetical protein
MFSKIIAAIGVIKEVIALIRMLLNWIEQEKVRVAKEREQKRNAAVDDSKKAQTDEEIWDAQDRIVDNRPKP